MTDPHDTSNTLNLVLTGFDIILGFWLTIIVSRTCHTDLGFKRKVLISIVGQVKLGNCGLVLGSSQFSILSQRPQK
jgi:hypothetical protein